MAIYLTRTMFEETLKTRFWLVGQGTDSYAMDLIEVSDGYSTPRQEQFSLRFCGNRNEVLPQRIYPMKHESIGEFDLFLVPIGQDESGTFYEAVFNRLIPTPSELGSRVESQVL